MSIIIKNAEFIAGAQTIADLPLVGLPEIAMVGRSNVGKSTFINRVLARKSLVRTSQTPGQTQQINLFQIKLADRGDAVERDIVLVDLPGFGYAKTSKDNRKRLQKLTSDYIRVRQDLAIVCVLNDARRDAQAEEIQIRNESYNAGRTACVVVTKADKLKRNETTERIKLVAAGYGFEPEDVIVTGEGIDTGDFWQRILLILDS